MVSLDSRSIKIIRVLLNVKGVITTSQLALKLNISPKMVRYRLNKVSSWLEDRAVTLSKESGKGLWLEGVNESLESIEQELEAISGYELILSPKQRQQIIIFTLILEHEPVIANKLALKLSVSRSTLFSDLDQISDWLFQHHLTLNRKPGYGIKIEGNELDKRKAIVDLIIEHVGNENILFILLARGQNHPADDRSSISLSSSPILTFLNSLQITHAYQFVSSIEDWNKISFSDYSIILLVLHISIMIIRIAQEKTVAFPGDQVDHLTNHPYFSNVMVGLTHLGRKLNLPISLDETLCFMTTILRMETSQHASLKPNFNLDDISTLQLVSNCLADIEGLLEDQYFSENEQILENLTQIFATSLARLTFIINLNNPLLEDFRNMHPDIHILAQTISDRISAQIGRKVSVEETGFIGMHLLAVLKNSHANRKTRILVVCPMGAVTSQLLAHRLHFEFPDIEIVDVMSVRKFLANPTIEADAIISTEEHLPVQTYLPVFHVHPLLKKEDVRRIKRWQLEKDVVPV